MSAPPSDETPFATVAVARPVRGAFTYAIPPALRGRLAVGQRLRVPFGRGQALAFFLAPAPAPAPAVAAKVRPIDCALEDEPALPADVVALARFAATHYRAPLGEALKAALPPSLATPAEHRPARARRAAGTVWAAAVPGARADALARARAPAQQAVLGYLLAVGGRAALDELCRAVPGARDSLRRLEERGLVRLELVEAEDEASALPGAGGDRPARLTPEQADAVGALEAELDRGAYAATLLHGVTGSGKTEVYLRLVERALARERGALVLVPEIALTPQLVGRFRRRFGAAVAVLHSALGDRERLEAWRSLRAGAVRIAVGVRSAVFAPVQRLGLVVVDEEHDPSFKQEEKLRYQARDLAVVRAHQRGCLVVLGSATPSLETLDNARRGRYRTIKLDRRVDDRPMPTVSVVDLRLERPRTSEARRSEPDVLSAPLRTAITETLERGQQVILFLNRRGHATFVVCEVCGESLKCPACDVCLTHHLSSRRLQCHYCGRSDPFPERCTACTGSLLALGVGTERVEAELVAAFPSARVARLDRDAVTTNERLTALLSAFARRELDVLVGTQMVAKGHDFPGVTLVCVVLADSALALPDFRAAERTFHLLTQVAGRAGRGVDPGRVLVQTYNPDALPIAAVLRHDFDGFAELEARRRRALAWPPATRLAALRIEGASAELTQRVALQLGRCVAGALPPASQGLRVLGPAPAPLGRIKGQTRWQLVLKAPTHAALQGPLDAVERALPELPRSVRVVIDVDPGALL